MSPGVRLLKNIMSQAEDAIGKYVATFTQLKEDFQLRSALDTGITVHRIATDIKHFGELFSGLCGPLLFLRLHFQSRRLI